jgi:F5/8 type C domain
MLRPVLSKPPPLVRGRLAMAATVLLLAAGSSLLLGQEPVPPRRGPQPEQVAKPEEKKPDRPRVDVKELPPVKTDNKNGLILKHRKELKFDASSFWPGWPMEKLVDGELQTSWFSAMDDTTTKGKTPWVEIIFPEDVTVQRVTVLGNREPAWLNGYTILAGKLELRDKDGKKLFAEENDGVGNFRDFDFKMKKAVQKVRSVRFTSLGDQGDQNPYTDIAIAEIQVD